MKNDAAPHWLGQLILGVGLGVLALAADAVDLKQNVAFGLESNEVTAVTYALAAIGVFVIPATAARLGWCWLLRAVAFASVLLTFSAGLNYHANSEGRRLTAGQDKSAVHETQRAEAEDARAEARAARAEAAQIAETVGAAQLGELVSQARARVASLSQAVAGRGVICQDSKVCRTAESELAALLQRQGLAEARAAAYARAERAEARATAAMAETKSGPIVLSGLAIMIADSGFGKGQGWTAEGVAWTVAEVLILARIALTMAFASLGGYAVRLIAEGWAARPRKTRAGKARDAVGTAPVMAILDEPARRSAPAEPAVEAASGEPEARDAEGGDPTPQDVKAARSKQRRRKPAEKRASKMATGMMMAGMAAEAAAGPDGAAVAGTAAPAGQSGEQAGGKTGSAEAGNVVSMPHRTRARQQGPVNKAERLARVRAGLAKIAGVNALNGAPLDGVDGVIGR